MKKTRLFSALAILALVGLTSCDKDILSSPVYVDNLPKASISGYVTAEMNLQTDGSEFVPVGTKLFVEVNYSDLNNAATGKWKDTVTVAENGKYQVAVPANGEGVTVTITPFAFEADQTQAYGALYKSIKKAFSTNPTSFTIRSGQAVSKDLTYTANDLPNFTDKVSISGKVQANLNAEIVGLENVPNGTVINFYNSGWKDSVIVQNGTYSIVVPKGEIIYWKSDFKYAKHVWNTNIASPSDSKYQDINYEYTISGSSSFFVNTTTNDLSAGEGMDLTVDPNANIVQVSGNATAELNVTTPGYENIPDGTKITFYALDNSWGEATTVTGGKYSISVPKNKTIVYYATFVYNKVLTVNPTTNSTTTYTLNGTISATSSSSFTYNMTAQ
ncbi:MAG: hypothetical protein Q8904_13315 [Bacteroidota bacterium]|nr:hypothetical protein [Bacteroidota bacterium]